MRKGFSIPEMMIILLVASVLLVGSLKVFSTLKKSSGLDASIVACMEEGMNAGYTEDASGNISFTGGLKTANPKCFSAYEIVLNDRNNGFAALTYFADNAIAGFTTPAKKLLRYICDNNGNTAQGENACKYFVQLCKDGDCGGPSKSFYDLRYYLSLPRDTSLSGGIGIINLVKDWYFSENLNIKNEVNEVNRSGCFNSQNIIGGECNTPPTISAMSDQYIPPSSNTGDLAFFVGDTETPNSLVMSYSILSMTGLTIDPSVVFGGSGANRTVRIIPYVGQSGSAIIQLTVTDEGGVSTSTTFNLYVFKDLFSWGSNGNGRLGNNSTTQSLVPIMPSIINGWTNKGAIDISAGRDHSCAIQNRELYCWGNNSNGPLGNNSTIQSLVPIKTPANGTWTNTNVTKVAAGSMFTCAIQSNELYCWGTSPQGQLGYNSTATSLVPIKVPVTGAWTNTNITGISAGGMHTCAIQSNSLYCWGGSNNGQVGNNSLSQSNVPIKVPVTGSWTNVNITAVSAGGSHTCAIQSNSLYCWGYNGYGQLGNNGTSDSSVPIKVPASGSWTNTNVTAVSAGGDQTCAIQNNELYCWGNNGQAELGNNTTTQSNVPIKVPVYAPSSWSNSIITKVAVGTYHTCAIQNGELYCWGASYNGALGNNSTTMSKVPIKVPSSGSWINAGIITVAAGYLHTLAY